MPSQPSVNSGGGLELLMNEKRKDSMGNKSSSKLDIADDLESELNALDGEKDTGVFDSKKDFVKEEPLPEPIEVTKNEDDKNSDADIGISTIKIGDSNKIKYNLGWL